MKAFQKISLWRTMFLLATVIFFFSCKPGDDPNDPTDPTDPTPTELVKPVVKSLTVENVTATSAKISAWVTPNEKDTKVYVEYKKTTETAYQSQAWVGNLTGKDSIKVSFDVVLTANNEYVAHIRANNKAGDNIAVTDVKFSTSVVTDYNGNTYHVIKIGNQYWLQENLRTTRYADGSSIIAAPTATEWETASYGNGAYCWYENNSDYAATRGGLYNFYVSKKTLINGYHIPSVAEFTTLYNYLGGGITAAKSLMDNSGKYWSHDDNLTPTNSSNFTALSTGARTSSANNYKFSRLTDLTRFILSTVDTVFEIRSSGECGFISDQSVSPESGISIRLIKD